MPRKVWEIKAARGDRVNALLADGWEPFAVVNHKGWTDELDFGESWDEIWLRRQVIARPPFGNNPPRKDPHKDEL